MTLLDFKTSSVNKDSKKELLGDKEAIIPAVEQRIREIEVGIEPEFYDVINDHKKAIE